MAKRSARGGSRQPAKKIVPEEELPEFVTDVHCVFGNDLGEYLGRMSQRGYDLVGQPIFIHFGEPPMMNGAVVGYKHPFMMTLLRRKRD